MKLYVKDGKIFFDYEGEHSDVFSYNAFGFRLRADGLREFVPTGDLKDDFDQLSLAVITCESYNVNIDGAVVAHVNELKSEYDKYLAERKAELERQQVLEKMKAHWEYIQKFGCGKCNELRRWNDDHVCLCAGKVVEEKCIAETVGRGAAVKNGVFYPFAVAPYPCEGCKFEYKEEL